MKKILIFTVLIFTLLFSVVTATDYGDLIQPGINIGPFCLGAFNVNYIESWLGKPDAKSFLDGGDIWLDYSTYKMNFAFDSSTQMVDMMGTQNPQYKTSLGIGVGSSIVDAKKYYPGGSNDGERYSVMSQGISFVFDKVTGEITLILIYPAVR